MIRTKLHNKTFARVRSGWRRLRRSPPALIGTVVVAIFLLLAVIGPNISPYGFDEQNTNARFQPPSALNLLGTDNLGRDVFSRLIWGTRDIISVAGVGTIIAVILGTTVGLVVGYRGGLADEIVFRLMDSLLALPAGLLALLLLGSLGPSRVTVIVVLVIVYIPIVARVVRSVVLDVKTKGFVEAAKIRGESNWYILTREILPSVLPALAVEGSLRFAYAIFLVATLGFLGVGVQRPAPDWGLMVADSRTYMSRAPWMVFYPCLAIAILVVSINLMADGLKQILQSSTTRE